MSALIDGIRMYENLGTFYGTLVDDALKSGR